MRKAKWKQSHEIEIAVRISKDEACKNKQLASKYYALWRKCVEQNKDTKSQLRVKQCQQVSVSGYITLGYPIGWSQRVENSGLNWCMREYE